MWLSESYKMRLIELAGLSGTKTNDEDPYAKKNERVPFNKDLMKKAIETGLEVAILFQSSNKKYKMPIAKYRVILPVAMGTDGQGRLMIRAVHIEGQSEKEAMRTGKRSAEAKNAWRLFNSANIKNMFITGKMYDKIPIGGFSVTDKHIPNLIVRYDAATVKKNQEIYKKNKEPKSEPKSTSVNKPAVNTNKPIVSKPSQPLSKRSEPEKVLIPNPKGKFNAPQTGLS